MNAVKDAIEAPVPFLPSFTSGLVPLKVSH
jgi:hypothetical protein